MTIFNYQEALDYLNNFTNYEKIPMPPANATSLNLERVRRFLVRLGEPQRRYPSIVIAGTKGKGSTAILINAALQAGGYRVGLYTQPHLHTYRERMQINGNLISREELAQLVTEMRPAIEKMLAEEAAEWGAITSYEVGTALALLYFARQEVDIAVLEIGLGGRLDAVNVVEPLVSVIASLSLDHTAILGDTIEEIAFEKAGIIKPAIPVVTVPQWPGAEQVLKQVSAERKADLSFVTPARLVEENIVLSPQNRRREHQKLLLQYGPASIAVQINLLGEHQRLNAALAAAALWQQQQQPGGLPLKAERLAEGFARAAWPARMQTLQDEKGYPLIVADGAHNAESAERLREALVENYYFEKLWLLTGIYQDKDVAGILRELASAPRLAGLIITASRNPRAIQPQKLAEIAGDQIPGMILKISQNVKEGLELARNLAGPLDLICVTGSLSVAAEAEEYFQDQ
ncbi:MAG TPA: folylpolyglutamate synthase/dihydrofolate synthase family protein [Chloroflexia bacterium]|nr:folylpolyglutamate synthase/dihydrofolate synthase family protein [Chloroflexia bacterium]